jgi:hypothetical protein
MIFEKYELVTLVSDSYYKKKGDKLFYLWDTTDSGYNVAFCVVDDNDLKKILKTNNYKSIFSFIYDLEKMNNLNSIEHRVNCIKPNHKDIVSKRVLLNKKNNLEEQLKLINKQIKLIGIEKI